jgi:DNA-binding NarL/FixJ family response regulator
MSRFRILLVEDEELAREALSDLLRRRIPECDIDAFGDVASAKTAIERLAAQSMPCDIAILDFKLPKSLGEAAVEIDETLCHLVSSLMPDAIIVHITGWMKDEKVRHHLDTVHQPASAGFSFDKEEKDNVADLIRRTKQTLYGRLIERELRGLESQTGAEGLRGREDLSALSTTGMMNRVCQDIETYWEDLHPALRARLEGLFGFEQQPDGSKKAYIK